MKFKNIWMIKFWQNHNKCKQFLMHEKLNFEWIYYISQILIYLTKSYYKTFLLLFFNFILCFRHYNCFFSEWKSIGRVSLTGRSPRSRSTTGPPYPTPSTRFKVIQGVTKYGNNRFYNMVIPMLLLMVILILQHGNSNVTTW